MFERTNTDYVGYHYVLWALGKAYRGHASQVTVRDKALRVWLKVPGLVGDADPWAERMPRPQRLGPDLVEEGRAIPIARVQAMHEGRRRLRGRRSDG